MDGVFLTVGQPWNDEVFRLDRSEPGFAWTEDNLLVVSDPVGLTDVDRFVAATPRIGFAQHGPLAVIAVKADGLPAPVLDYGRVWRAGHDAPEVRVSDEEHILWQMATVVRGVVVNLRAFTTSPQVTQFLRRVFAEQRAAGPLSDERAATALGDWYRVTGDPKRLWNRMVVTCKAGD